LHSDYPSYFSRNTGEIDKRQIAIEIGRDLDITIEINQSGTGVKVVLLPDQRTGAEETEMIRALERRDKSLIKVLFLMRV